MLGRFMDWIDEITGYDRDGARVILVIIAIMLFLSAWLAYDAWLKPEACDAQCREDVRQIIENNPGLFATEPVPTIDLNEFR